MSLWEYEPFRLKILGLSPCAKTHLSGGAALCLAVGLLWVFSPRR